MAPRLRVTCAVRCCGGESPETQARRIALEQTVELPEGSFPAALEDRVVGRVEEVVSLDPTRFRTTISYPEAAIGDDFPQLLNVLYGNASLLGGVQVVAAEWAPGPPAWVAGPGHGLQGLRELSRVWNRPLVCVALKPIGLSAGELARLCGELAASGVDLIKDDHGLANQRTAPLDERLPRCLEAVARANQRSGRSCLYLPNLTGERLPTADLLARWRGLGVQGCMVAPLLAGFPVLRHLSRAGFAVVAHPALAGAFFAKGHGVAAETLLGTLFRWAGADGVIYPNSGGRFPFSAATCEAIARELRRPVPGVRAAFPVLGGGLDLSRLPEWQARFGHDAVWLVGGSLYRHSDLGEAARAFVERVGEVAARAPGVTVETEVER